MKLFEERHPDLVFRRPRPLDPKRAKCFNPASMKHHFEEFAQARLGVLDQDVYNADEIGLQRGGGRKSLNLHFAFSVDDAARIRIRSDNLELTTIIDIICADGTKPVPGFIFAGKETYEVDWFDIDGIL
jgi:hypothetical protein